VQLLINQKAIGSPKEEKGSNQKATRSFQETLGSNQEDKPAAEKKESPRKGEKALIEKICKNCNQPFFAKNPKQSTCSQKCRTAYNRRK